jgi:hypothetical protein
MFKKSNNPKVEELIKSVTDRSCPLDRLRVIRVVTKEPRGHKKLFPSHDEDPSANALVDVTHRFCAWCTKEELFHGNRKYCSTDCSESAEASFYPQKELGLKLLLERQDYKCSGCQFDYRPFMDAIVEKDRRAGASFEEGKLPFYYFKRLKSRVPKDKKPEVDHILAISKGGQSIGLANHQVLCFNCHKTKTKVDNSGPRSKK